MSEQFVCRLCLQDSSELFEVFNNFHDERRIDEVISFHCHIDIKETDILNKVCTRCWLKVGSFHEFFCSVQKAQENIGALIESRLVKAVLEDKEELGIIVFENIENENAEASIQFKTESSSLEPVTIDDHFDDNILDSDSGDNDGSEKDTTQKCGESECPATLESTKKTCNLNSSANDSENKVEIFTVEKPLIVENETVITTCDEIATIPADPEANKEHNDQDANGPCEDLSSSSEEYEPKVNTKKRAKGPVKEKENAVKKEKEERIIEQYYKLQCDICNKEAKRYEELCGHYIDVHKVRGFIVCCSKKFFRRSVIAEHVLRHTNPDLFKCSVCNKIYADKRCLNNHMLVHAPADMKLFKCDRCPKSFVKKFKLEQHKLSHLTPEEKKYICDECEKPYASDALLRAHKRVVHEKTYAHMCEICAKVFNSRIFFEKHQLEHLGKSLPRVQCKLCSAWMKNEHTMRAHMRLHQDEGFVHKCDICGKQGPSRNAILKHKRFVHLSERKFKCTLCDKAFKRAITLKEHMTVHTGEVLYTCTFCPKTFNSSANMHAHRKKAHPLQWEEEKRVKTMSLKVETVP